MRAEERIIQNNFKASQIQDLGRSPVNFPAAFCFLLPKTSGNVGIEVGKSGGVGVRSNATC